MRYTKADAATPILNSSFVSAKAMREIARCLTLRQRLLLLLLAACLTAAVSTINTSHRRLHLPPPPPEQQPGQQPKLGALSMKLKDEGVVDGGAQDQSPRLWDSTEERSLPRSWSWLEDDQEAPKRSLLTPEHVRSESESERERDGDLSAPDTATVGKHVRVLWIGELSEAPDYMLTYVERGFNVTVHTSADRILDGFVPHVRRAFERAIPRVAGFDFLKLLLLYKHGGFVVDADTWPVVDATEIELPSECDVLLGKETHLGPDKFTKPIYRRAGGPTYLFNRPYQLLNWAMIATKPRNRHIEELITGAMRHFLGLRDMEMLLVQDVAGSGLLSDYVALLHEEHGFDYAATFEDRDLRRPIEGLCMLEGELRGGWIAHAHMATWHGE